MSPDTEFHSAAADREITTAYFRNSKTAERAIHALRQAGFAQIGVASHDPKQAETIADRTDANAGLALGESDPALRETGGEPDYSSPRDLHGSLLEAHVPEAAANYFASCLEKQGVLVTVQSQAGRAAEARRVLESEGADFGEKAASAGEPSSPPTRPASSPRDETTGAGQVIELRGELLRIHKDRVRRGEVRVRKQIVTERQQFEVPVTHEEVVVESVPHPDASAGPSARPSAQEVRLPLSEEKVRVEKQPVVTDAVRVAKREVTDTQPVREDVRHEELEVEDEDQNLTPEQRAALRARRPAA